MVIMSFLEDGSSLFLYILNIREPFFERNPAIVIGMTAKVLCRNTLVRYNYSQSMLLLALDRDFGRPSKQRVGACTVRSEIMS